MVVNGGPPTYPHEVRTKSTRDTRIASTRFQRDYYIRPSRYRGSLGGWAGTRNHDGTAGTRYVSPGPVEAVLQHGQIGHAKGRRGVGGPPRWSEWAVETGQDLVPPAEARSGSNRAGQRTPRGGDAAPSPTPRCQRGSRVDSQSPQPSDGLVNVKCSEPERGSPWPAPLPHYPVFSLAVWQPSPLAQVPPDASVAPFGHAGPPRLSRWHGCRGTGGRPLGGVGCAQRNAHLPCAGHSGWSRDASGPIKCGASGGAVQYEKGPLAGPRSGGGGSGQRRPSKARLTLAGGAAPPTRPSPPTADVCHPSDPPQAPPHRGWSRGGRRKVKAAPPRQTALARVCSPLQLATCPA